MKNIIIDINIFMDFLFKREGHEKVVEIFRFCIKGIIHGFICAHEITTLYYFLNKSIKDKNKIKKSISGIMRRFKVIEINEERGCCKTSVLQQQPLKNACFVGL
jgi:predicted nucleic acid-binding protein